MHWESFGTVLGVIQGLAVVILLVMQAGSWKARREDSTKNLGGTMKTQAAALEQVQNLVVRKVDLAACDDRFRLIGQELDQRVTREHCSTLHNQAKADYDRISRISDDAARAAQAAATNTAVIATELKGLSTQVGETNRRLGRIEAALMGKGIKLEGGKESNGD